MVGLAKLAQKIFTHSILVVHGLRDYLEDYIRTLTRFHRLGTRRTESIQSIIYVTFISLHASSVSNVTALDLAQTYRIR